VLTGKRNGERALRQVKRGPFERGYGVTVRPIRFAALFFQPGRRRGFVPCASKSSQGRDGKPKTTHVSHEFTADPGLFEDIRTWV